MNSAREKQADEARSALVSDIEELKKSGKEALGEASAALPWMVGGGLAVIAIATAIAMRPARRSFGAPPRSLLGQALRAAALSAVGLLARRLASQALDKVLPEPEPAKAELPAQA